MAGYQKKGQDEASAVGGFYDDPPLSKFKKVGGEWVPVVNWLRQCPWNEASNRWHIPMKDNRTEKTYWMIYNWMRGKEWEYLPIIHEAMGMKKGLFIDTASQYNYGDYWLVADENMAVDRSLLSASATGPLIAKPIFSASTQADMRLPDQNGVFSMRWQTPKEPWDAQLQQAMEVGQAALASMKNKSRYMKYGA